MLVTIILLQFLIVSLSITKIFRQGLSYWSSSQTQVLGVQVGHLALFHLSSKIDINFKWFWMISFCKNTLLMLDFRKVPFLVLHISSYILMTFQMILYVILRSRLMIILCTQNESRHLICSSNQSWLLNLNLIYETLQSEAESGLLILMLKNSTCFI